MNGQFRGQFLSHMDLGHSKKKSKRRAPTISQVRANPHAALKKKSTRHPYARGHTHDTVYYHNNAGKSRQDTDRAEYHKDGLGRG